MLMAPFAMAMLMNMSIVTLLIIRAVLLLLTSAETFPLQNTKLLDIMLINLDVNLTYMTLNDFAILTIRTFVSQTFTTNRYAFHSPFLQNNQLAPVLDIVWYVRLRAAELLVYNWMFLYYRQ